MKKKSNVQKYNYSITAKQIYTKDNEINISLVKHLLSEGNLIQPQLLKQIIFEFKHILKTQPNVIKISDPVIIVGDIHGQYFDLIKILALFSQQKISSSKSIDTSIKKQSFVFLGDYVDRGIMAIEVMSILMLMKLMSPNNVFLLRGNHQSRIMSEIYNFKQECAEKYGQQIFQYFMEAFDFLPIACIVNQKYFCVHGGITDKIRSINQIQKIQRNNQIPLSGPYCDFIWSDPTPAVSGKLKTKTQFNDSRECSIYFGVQLAQQFLRQNKLLTIVRGHEVFQQGYKTYNWLKKQTPQAITVFSAPNYCNSYGNKGAVMRIDNDKVKIRQYNQEIPQNYRLADKLQVFNWSLDKICSSLNEFSQGLINRICELYIEDLVDQPIEKQLAAFLEYQSQKTKNNKKLFQTSYQRQSWKKSKFSIKDMQSQDANRASFHNQQEKKKFQFRRSRDYFKDTQKMPNKIPATNKFKGTMENLKKQNTTI